MPIYEYRCRDCGAELEKLQRISDDPLVDCPACGGASLKRLISAAGFRLKGSGWYETDFKSGQKRNLAESAEPGKNGGESKPAKESAATAGKSEAAKDAGTATAAKGSTASSSADAG